MANTTKDAFDCLSVLMIGILFAPVGYMIYLETAITSFPRLTNSQLWSKVWPVGVAALAVDAALVVFLALASSRADRVPAAKHE
jgi:hypothetical protein